MIMMVFCSGLQIEFMVSLPSHTARVLDEEGHKALPECGVFL